ncbi:carbonic anhydrase [Aestuariibaculum lutulentum]|uniref:Carbonic anhydrase n=1 Tax=Aestuariibaculum lutulentum TaxID=2920935 RepID=A0ABS9RFY7_9FLAO|nr:carbonic anhydrase family protein [Aestuariibaculum lutulentum]MCH4551868.1 carbonic anhydrase family protein [Aestuariibaculum lutulentum]
MNTRIICYLCFSIMLFSCQEAAKKSKDLALNIHEKRHWSYSGETSPEHWEEIEKNSSCGGAFQSPINIIHRDVDSLQQTNLKIQYNPTTFINKVENNGHSIQFDFELGDSINYKNKTYFLKQIHFHEPSEHKINGIVYPIEMHLVHMNSDGEVTVLGVLGEEGEGSVLFEFFESFLPIKEGAFKEINQHVDLSSLMLNEKQYYSYQGSLTTPPCTENVNWIVFKEPIILSEAEVLKLRSNMPVNNYRNAQPLNGRRVNYNY